MEDVQNHLFDTLEGIREETYGFLDLEICDDDEEMGGQICADLAANFGYFKRDRLFDVCSDKDARTFLLAFLRGELRICWSLSVEMARLLAHRGHLVKDEAEQVFQQTSDWNSMPRSLCLTYLVQFEDGPERALQFVEQSRDEEVRESYRDGLFMACFQMESEALDKALASKFLEWDRYGEVNTATGGWAALGAFLSKWINLYPASTLEDLLRLYFRKLL